MIRGVAITFGLVAIVLVVLFGTWLALACFHAIQWKIHEIREHRQHLRAVKK